ncbi:unnamed protein product [Rotaria magnacalcarata]|uniref:Uncharacterized protein n=1 Tax=Rotaria magnacalcarata TaxID=392030 RepID=A0A8S2WLF6_9BILA|nr:unnamed protein product [Rotaria magnacalcarata]CAF4449652.1 unnamed protein product [Rotaria magnacalcarata]
MNLNSGAIGAGKFYQSEKICGACYQSAKHGICSTVNCTHEEMKIPSDDTVEIVLFDLAEQLKMLINKNIDLVKKYQDESQTQSTSDANDIVRGDVYQSILRIEKIFLSKNCNAWLILGAVLELSPYSRNRADNTLLLALWIGKKL